MNRPIDVVVSACESLGLKVTGRGDWKRCPHPCSPDDDRDKRSFAFRELGDGTVVISTQKPSYTKDQCLEALGLTWKDLFPENDLRPESEWKGQRIVHGYEYTDSTGNPKGRVTRTEKKEFPQGHYENGQYVQGLNGAPLPLYMLSYVKAWAEEGRTIYVVEGEKDARNMIREGFAATTKPGGAKSPWLECHTGPLAKCDIVVVADKDEAGEGAARAAVAALRPIAKSLAVVEAKTGKDATDHLESGHTPEDFVARHDLEKPASRLKVLSSYEPEEPKFLWEPYIRDEQCNMLDAKGGSGKTTFIIALAAAGSLGYLPFGQKCEPFSTLYYGNEDSGGEIRATFDEIKGDADHFFPVTDPFVLDAAGFERVALDIEEARPRLVVFDAIKYYLSGGEKAEFDAPTVARTINTLRETARRYSCSFLLVRHFSKFVKDKDMLDMGAGISQWRDSCRSQLVMLKHPGKPRNSVVWHTKGSLRGREGEAFALGWGSGEFGWWHPTQADFDQFGMDSQGKKSTVGRPSTSLDRAIEFLEKALLLGGRRVGAVVEEAETEEISRATLYRAARQIGVTTKDGFWFLKDPFAD